MFASLELTNIFNPTDKLFIILSMEHKSYPEKALCVNPNHPRQYRLLQLTEDPANVCPNSLVDDKQPCTVQLDHERENLMDDTAESVI